MTAGYMCVYDIGLRMDKVFKNSPLTFLKLLTEITL